MAKRKRRGSSKAGRPRKTGERYPSGKLKPEGPNETLLERRKAGDASAGEHPLDFALSNAWISERDHRAAKAYVSAFNRSHVGGFGPRLSQGSLPEVEPSENLRMNWSQLSDEEITGIFDKVFSIIAPPLGQDEREAQARALWKRLNTALSAAEQSELFMVCVIGSWPLWMPKKAADHALGIKDTTREALLISALDCVSRALRPAKKAEAVIEQLPTMRRTRAGRAELAVRYETQDGDEITAMSERGMPFEVTILRKRA